jgi:hypothetical protein
MVAATAAIGEGGATEFAVDVPMQMGFVVE